MFASLDVKHIICYDKSSHDQKYNGLLKSMLMPYSFLFCKKCLLKIFYCVDITSINQEIVQWKNMIRRIRYFDTNRLILFKRYKNVVLYISAEATISFQSFPMELLLHYNWFVKRFTPVANLGKIKYRTNQPSSWCSHLLYIVNFMR